MITLTIMPFRNQERKEEEEKDDNFDIFDCLLEGKGTSLIRTTMRPIDVRMKEFFLNLLELA